MSNKPQFYYIDVSPPCRTVVAIARMLNVEMDMKVVNLAEREQFKPEYLKLNPFHQVPTFVDTDGFTIVESRAICTYLIQSRKPDSNLYPSGDLKQRTNIDRWLQYDCGTLFFTLRNVLVEKLYGSGASEFRINIAKETLKTLDEFMGGEHMKTKFLAGNEITLADVSIFFTLNGLMVVMPEFNMEDYKHIKEWYERVWTSIKPYDHDKMFEGAIEKAKTYLAQLKAKIESAKK